MKNRITSISALLLVLWYSLSVIGFDVHTCTGSGETYIATVISGTECEDIHPEHAKKPCSCCHNHESSKTGDTQNVRTKPCCNDDWQMIVLTGVRNEDERTDLAVNLHPVTLEYPGLIAANDNSDFISSGRWTIPKPDSGNSIPINIQQVYNVWRI